MEAWKKKMFVSHSHVSIDQRVDLIGFVWDFISSLPNRKCSRP